MLAFVKSMSLHGLDGYLVDVQLDVGSRASKVGDCAACLIQVLKNQKKELGQL